MAGSFNDWQEPVELHKASNGKDWSVTLAVPPGLQQVTSCNEDPSIYLC